MVATFTIFYLSAAFSFNGSAIKERVTDEVESIVVALIPASILVKILGTFAINVGFHNFKSSKRVNGVPPSLGNATDPPNKNIADSMCLSKI